MYSFDKLYCIQMMEEDEEVRKRRDVGRRKDGTLDFICQTAPQPHLLRRRKHNANLFATERYRRDEGTTCRVLCLVIAHSWFISYANSISGQ